jgi:hypothetical protein
MVVAGPAGALVALVIMGATPSSGKTVFSIES